MILHTIFMMFVHLHVYLHQYWIYIVKFWLYAPPGGPDSISCSFWGNLAKLYVGAPPGQLAPPPQGNPGSTTVHVSFFRQCQLLPLLLNIFFLLSSK